VLVGLAFQLDLGIIKISIVTLSLYLLFIISFLGKKNRVADDSKKSLFSMKLLFFYVFASAVLGLVVGNSIEDIKQDVIGFVHLWLVYYCAKKLEIKDIQFVWKTIIIISIFAVLKILYINFSDVPVEWTNVWQARKDPLPGLNWNRIVLNGGDIYLTFSLISVFTFMIYRSKYFNPVLAIIAFIVLTFSVFISLSRSSYLAVGVGFVVSLLIALFRREVTAKKIIVAILWILIVPVIVAYYASDTIDLGNIYLARIDAYDAEGGSLMWREIENENVFNEVQKSWLFGNGMGATYKFFVDKSERANDTNIFTHNFITWVLLKMGALGLTIVFVFFGQVLYVSHKFMILTSIERENKILLVALTSSFIGLIVISILANKMFYTEGSMFIGLYLAFLFKLSVASDHNKMIKVNR
jgi:hypothetical protein